MIRRCLFGNPHLAYWLFDYRQVPGFCGRGGEGRVAISLESKEESEKLEATWASLLEIVRPKFLQFSGRWKAAFPGVGPQGSYLVEVLHFLEIFRNILRWGPHKVT